MKGYLLIKFLADPALIFDLLTKKLHANVTYMAVCLVISMRHGQSS